MPISSITAANCFLDIALRENMPITHLKLQKLLYFAHGWYLALTGEPLFEDKVEAWQFGPVIPPVYHQFKKYGNQPIDGYSDRFSPEQLQLQDVVAARSLLERVWAVYSKYTASQLSALSHEVSGPWQQTIVRQPEGPINNAEITNDMMREFFRSKLQT